MGVRVGDQTILPSQCHCLGQRRSEFMAKALVCPVHDGHLPQTNQREHEHVAPGEQRAEASVTPNRDNLDSHRVSADPITHSCCSRFLKP